MEFDASQKAAIDLALTGRDCLISGGAGTGKTTIIQEIARAKEATGGSVICAPTGKAAARLKEATGYFAQTIHRLLGWTGEDFIGKPEPIHSPVIIDEASMVDSWLLAKVLEANPPQVVLVGDSAQLPPVGKGQPFHDLLRLRPQRAANLTTCYRSQAAVHHAAQKIRNGEAPEIHAEGGGETWHMEEHIDANAITTRVVELIRSGWLNPKTDIVLSPKHGAGEENDGGILAINKAIMGECNPHDDGESWKEGDRVIMTKNFGPDDLWNGDLGTISDIGWDGLPWVTLDRQREKGPAKLKKDQIRELKHAWCLSVHKSQGSQFRRVVVVCLKEHRFMLTRSLIYTAVTRTREQCYVLGHLGAFYNGINRVDERRTVLQAVGGLI